MSKMKYKLYKLTFSTPVHFGKGRLGSAENRFLADRLFSAFCTEAAKTKGDDEIEYFCKAAKNGQLLLSDGMPFIGDTLYLPKPILSIEHSADESSSILKKEFKKLSYIPVCRFDDYFKGDLDAAEENIKLSGLGKFCEKTSVCIREGEDARPYRIGLFSFSSGCGLYFIIGYENDEIFYRFDDMMYSLGYTGIGGKVSSGLGKFDAVLCDVPDELMKMLSADDEGTVYISLSVCMADENELESITDGAEYSIVKRSGFVNSVSYSNTFRKRKELYCFAAGSSFRKKFSGDVFDLSDGGTHPVYRYAKPLFLGVKL